MYATSPQRIARCVNCVCCWLFQELPKLVDGGEPEEGPAAVPGEEEFDLSEIMAEELNAVLSKEGRLQQVG